MKIHFYAAQNRIQKYTLQKKKKNNQILVLKSWTIIVPNIIYVFNDQREVYFYH